MQLVPAIINNNSLMLGLGYVFNSTGMLHGQYIQKTGSGKDINIVRTMDKKTNLTFENTHKNARREKKVAKYMFLENFDYFLIFAFS